MKTKYNMLKLNVWALCLALVFSLASCGAGGEEEQDMPPDVDHAESQQPLRTLHEKEPMPENENDPHRMEEKYEQVFEVELATTGNNMQEMKYSAEVIKVPAKHLIRLTLENKAEDPAMVHNLVVVRQGEMENVAMAGLRVGLAKDFVPRGTPGLLAWTPLAQPGETVVAEFNAPPPGEYEFTCTYPGHWSMMNGKFIVLAEEVE